MKNCKDTIKHSLISVLVLTLLLWAIPGMSVIAVAGNPPSSLNSAFGSFNSDDDADFVLDEVLIPAASQQNAQEIAEAYGLELLSYAWGIAVLAASDPLETVVQSDLLNSLMGGLAARIEIPKLSLNRLYSTYTDDRKYDMEHSYFSSTGPYASDDKPDREGYAKTLPGMGYEEKYGSSISRAGTEKYSKAYPGKADGERYASSHSDKTDGERYTRTPSYRIDRERYASVPPYKHNEGMQANAITPGYDRHTDQGSLSYGFEISIRNKVNDLNSTLNTQHSKLGLQSSPAMSGSDSQWHHELMDTERAWDLALGEGALVAVIDTGIDLKHPKFEGRIANNSYDSHADRIGIEYVQDDEGHGTHVSGIIAASLAGDEDACGVAPKAGILTIKANIPSAPNFFESASLYRAINYAAANGADIINMSLGRNYADGWSADELEHQIIINAVKNGVTVVCAAGNDSDNHAGYPAAYPEAIAVSALRQGGVFENYYSNHGPEIDISAPGSDIYSTANGGDYLHLSGTSMASPNVAGVAALVKSLHPEYTPGQVRDILCETARAAGALGKNDYYGWGIINAFGAALGIDALHKVTYDFNDGEREPIVVRVVPGNKLIEQNWPVRDGYAFEGWYTDASGGEGFDFTAEINEDIVLYARWIEIEPGMYAAEFPDPNFCREVLRLLNDGDNAQRTPAGMISMEDKDLLASFTWLSVDNQGIYDLTGLAYFGDLEVLFCNNNQLTSLDLSENTGILYLYCYDNQLITLDISKNHLLQELNCRNNLLTDLDLSANADLVYLFCNNNQLTSLDFSQNRDLIAIDLAHNQLQDLDISNNPELWLVGLWGNQLRELNVSNNPQLGWLNCDSNQLTGLDLSDNPALEWLDCRSNQLTTLDLTNNPALLSLICLNNQLRELDLAKNTVLKELFCGNNLLTGLDVTKNVELMHLGCSDNKLTILDVSRNSRLIYLGCRNNQLTALDLSQNIDLSWINCSNNQLIKLDVSNNIVLEGLNCNENLLTELELGSADLSGTNWWYFSEGDENYTPGLQCFGNHLTTLDISRNTALKMIDCSFNFLKELNVSANPELKWLYTPYNYMETPGKVSGWETVSGLILEDTFYFYPQCSGEPPTGKDITASFKNPAFLAAIREIISKPDEPVLDYDVTRIWGLNLDSWNTEHPISDLSGIEHFSSLTYLSCASQQLTELDLAKNGALRELYCYNNLLTELDLANNPKLEYLDCGNNQLIKMKIADNSALRNLWCYDNRLTTLDLSGSVMLTNISCNYNQLMILDLSNTPLLESLYCCENRLTGLDVSDNFELRQLDCGYNRLAELDISNNPELRWLYCNGNDLAELSLADNPELIVLGCSDNRLKELDISHNLMLVGLDCSYNPLLDLDLSNNPGLEYLYCYNIGLTELSFVDNPKLILLNCGSNPLQELDLSNNPGLEYLFCYNNDLTELDISGNPALREFYCSQNRLKELDVSDHSELLMFYCSDNQLTDLDISNNLQLIYLDCSNNMLTELDLSNNPALLSLWCHATQLTELSLEKNTMLESMCCSYTQLAELDISKNPGLRYLDCDGNRLGALNLFSNPLLEWLYCRNNQLTDLDLSKNPELRWLDCGDNILTGLDVANNTELIGINCTYNYLVSESIIIGLAAIRDQLEYFEFYPQHISAGVSVSGRIKSHNPGYTTNIQLIQGKEVVYQTRINDDKGNGQVEQSFAFKYVEPGTYDLVIIKPLHTKFTVKDVVVGREDLDLINDDRPEVQLMTLRCGDINGDGLINDADLTILWLAYNYNRGPIVIEPAVVTGTLRGAVNGITGYGGINSWLTGIYIEGAKVVLRSEIDGPVLATASGGFNIENLQVGAYYLEVSANGYISETVQVQVLEEGGNYYSIFLVPVATELCLVNGRIIDVYTGLPVTEEVELTFYRAADYDTLAEALITAKITAKSGVFSINLPAGSYVVEFGGKDYYTLNTLFYALGGQTVGGDLWLYPKYDF